MLRPLPILAVVCCAPGAWAQSQSTVSAVTSVKPTTSAVTVTQPSVSKGQTSKVTVSQVTMTSPTTTKPTTSKVNVTTATVSPVKFGGGGGGSGSNGESGLDAKEQDLVNQAAKDDYDWKSQNLSGHALVSAQSRDETDATLKARDLARDAGLSPEEQRKLERAASQQVENGGPPARPVVTPASAANTAPDEPETVP